jgi:iron-sulfur cluster protein
VDAKNLKEYRKLCQESLDNEYLRTTLDTFAVAYRSGRANAFAGIDIDQLVADVAQMKDDTLKQLDDYLDRFTRMAEAAGVVVHHARDGDHANRIVAEIGHKAGCKRIIKTKSMTAEETHLVPSLEREGFEVTETDLGEWIVQLRNEPPSHMVMPAIHLSRYHVRDLFSEITGKKEDEDIEKLVKVSRNQMRKKFAQGEMGITGANFAVAETGTIGIVTNEGNARLVTTLPRVHVALLGIDKLVPTVADALSQIKVLTRNATAQQITSYVTWVTGANQCGAAEDGRKEVHFVLLDNGRREMVADPLFSQVFRCVRCGACANVCPVYRLVGGHKMGHVYIGAIGLILTYFFHGEENARNLVQNCINCEACKDICAGGIDLPRLIKEIHARIQDNEGHPLPSLLLGKVLRNRKLFHTLLRTAKWAQKPVAGSDGFMRHLPMIFFKEHDFKALPTIADKPFRDRWAEIRPQVENPQMKVGLFSGCVQDFVYPEQMAAAVALFKDHNVSMVFPMQQSCCGLPVQMMGERSASRDVALQNLNAFAKEDVDHIVTLCASCASHLKHNYPVLLADDPKVRPDVEKFCAKVIDLSSFVHDVLKVEEADFVGDGKSVTFHAPCHLCRGLGVKDAPRNLMRIAGMDYRESAEEDVCCGFGGTYSAKFPELSEQLLSNKLSNIEASGAVMVLTDCPGCIMQIRGGMQKRGMDIEVKHTVEALSERRKKK